MSDEQSYVSIDAEDFLELVWGDRVGWVDLPAKVSTYWVSFPLLWPADRSVSVRIDTCLRDREDLYYSVAQFAQRGRKIEDVLSCHWLWADLDEVHPSVATGLGFMPTVAIESSPGRYQALWRLSRRLGPGALEKLNRGLSYALDADRGGWDLTQVLRLPGTRNFKYSDAPLVRCLWIKEDLVYDARKIYAAVKGALPQDAVGDALVSLPRTPISSKAKALLRVDVADVVEGERSARLWELECLLAESGLSADDIFGLVRGSAWNKWRGTGDSGRRRLRADIQKALSHVARQRALSRDTPSSSRVLDRGRSVGSGEAVSGDEDADGDVSSAGSDNVPSGDDALPWVGYSSFMAMAMEEPKWLIENIWTAGSHGIIGGEPKTSKTTIALALALSVASGAPFLGQYSVGVTGPVLMVQEENAPWMMQDRLRKLASYMGLIAPDTASFRSAGSGALGETAVDLSFPHDLPLRLLNNFGYDLGLSEHRDMLEAEVEALRPALVVLDPLYLILAADSSSADDLRSYLKWLLALRYEYDTAVAVVHHMGKAPVGGHGARRPGQRLLGSTTLHGWADSAIYLERREEDREGWISVSVETEFRSMAPQKGQVLSLSMGLPGGLLMEVELGSYSAEHAIREVVEREGSGISVKAVCEALSLDRRTLIGRIRGGELGMTVSTGGGRSKVSRVYLNGDAPSPSSPTGGREDS